MFDPTKQEVKNPPHTKASSAKSKALAQSKNRSLGQQYKKKKSLRSYGDELPRVPERYK